MPQSVTVRLCYVLYRWTDAVTDGGDDGDLRKKHPSWLEKVGRPYTYLMGTVKAIEIVSLVIFDVPPSFFLAFRVAGSHGEASHDEEMFSSPAPK